ncbi:MAG: SAM-dependent methyltransferase [Elusimicrobiota bacterium]
MLTRLRLAWHRYQARRKMNRVFSRRADPFKYSETPYEQERLEAMAGAVAGRRWKNVLEIGAAEGHFTGRLSEIAEKVVAVELSPVAARRLREFLGGRSWVEVVESDLRDFEPSGKFDLIVLGDVLYYMDKPLVRDEFEAVFPRLSSWLAPGGRMLLAHGFCNEPERKIRTSYRERFEKAGLTLESESVVGKSEKDGDVRCLLSLLGARG